jgi:hypothetical protein
MTAQQCMRCGRWWTHNAGPRENFDIVTRLCPLCIPAVYPAVRR